MRGVFVILAFAAIVLGLQVKAPLGAGPRPVPTPWTGRFPLTFLTTAGDMRVAMVRYANPCPGAGVSRLYEMIKAGDGSVVRTVLIGQGENLPAGNVSLYGVWEREPGQNYYTFVVVAPCSTSREYKTLLMRSL